MGGGFDKIKLLPPCPRLTGTNTRLESKSETELTNAVAGMRLLARHNAQRATERVKDRVVDRLERDQHRQRQYRSKDQSPDQAKREAGLNASKPNPGCHNEEEKEDPIQGVASVVESQCGLGFLKLRAVVISPAKRKRSA